MKIGTQTMILGLILSAFSGYSTTATANESSETMADAANVIAVSAKRASLDAA